MRFKKLEDFEKAINLLRITYDNINNNYPKYVIFRKNEDYSNNGIKYLNTFDG